MTINIPLTKDQLKVRVFWVLNIILISIVILFFPFGIVALVPLFVLNFIAVVFYHDPYDTDLTLADFYPFLKWFTLKEEE